jgi:hypothetical protein
MQVLKEYRKGQEENDQEAIDKIVRVLIRTFFISIGLLLFQNLSHIQIINHTPVINYIGTVTVSLILSMII